MVIDNHTTIGGALQIIGGAFVLNNGAHVNLNAPTLPLIKTINALIE